MDEDLYDEFGNYIGPSLNADGDEGDEIMGEDWINEINRLQRGESEDSEEIEHPQQQPKDSLVAYQGNFHNSFTLAESNFNPIDINDDPNQNAIVLHEDKQYYSELNY